MIDSYWAQYIIYGVVTLGIMFISWAVRDMQNNIQKAVEGIGEMVRRHDLLEKDFNHLKADVGELKGRIK